MRRLLWIPWRWWRRASQWLLLLLFLWLFRRTQYGDSDLLAGGENLLFRLDPLVGATAMLAARQWIAQCWPGLLLAALTLVGGRFFCGWACPLGTLLDGFHRLACAGPLAVWRRLHRHSYDRLEQVRSTIARAARFLRYLPLFTVLAAAAIGFSLIGWIDPFSLLFRGLTFWVDPMWYDGADAVFQWSNDGWIASHVQPWAGKHLLPAAATTFQWAAVSAVLLAVPFLLELVGRRFWCRYVCPTGALLELLSRGSRLQRVPARPCPSCRRCADVCPMDAVDPNAGATPESCTLCMNCVDACPKEMVQFRVKSVKGEKGAKGTKEGKAGGNLSRRGAIAGLIVGATVPAAAAVTAWRRPASPPVDLLRPPGVGDESRFLDLCVRCGECMKVCPTNVLQPSWFEAGLEGAFAPRVAVRFQFERGYCEFGCTLCGQVCPTGAIPRLSEKQKQSQPIGLAYLDHRRCLPWAESTPCIRCEEMCPTKAITVVRTYTAKDKAGQDVEIQQPAVDRTLCIGCGICESSCTIPGVAGIHVLRPEAPNPGTEFLLKDSERKPT
ncbi:MAG: 4Fe-4S binding protein [Thermoguttaceae bacterium]